MCSEGFYDLGIRTSWQYAIKATEDINFSGLFVKLSVFVEFRVFRTFVHLNTFVFAMNFCIQVVHLIYW